MSSNSHIVQLDELIRAVTAANKDNPRFTIENVILAGKTEEMARLIDQVFIQGGLGPVKSGLTRSLYGVNFFGGSATMPLNRDRYGLTFFTRPMMNMTSDNLLSDRIMSKLLNEDENSIHRLIRATLDAQVLGSHNLPRFDSPFINPRSAFIPILSNTLVSLSGWPDLDSQTFTSAAGNWREEYSFVDGIIQDYRTWDMTCNFKNVDGNIITNLFFYWVIYQACVAGVGNLLPYPIMNLGNEIDYNTAIYRVTLDGTNTFMTGIARTIAFPLTCPKGAQYNFESDQTLNLDQKQVSIQFRCHGAEYDDDILVYEFNRAVELMDPDFRDHNRNRNYVKLPKSLWRVFSGKAQPRIDPMTYEFEWWIEDAEYRSYLTLTDAVDANSVLLQNTRDQVNAINKNRQKG